MRAIEHVTETRSRQIVSSLLDPATFVVRDPTERDYGVDQLVDVFFEQEPSGTSLLLQVRGTTGPLSLFGGSQDVRVSSFSVKELVRATRYAVPFLLVRVPVCDQPRRFYYLWLQEYARVVLDYDQPGWRFQSTVTLRIPARNVAPAYDLTGRLMDIAAAPLRSEALSELARVAHELRYADGHVRQLLPLLAQARATRALEYPPPALWARTSVTAWIGLCWRRAS